MKAEKSVTLRDVASKADLSPSTVSRILNGDMIERYHPETRQRVIDLAQKLGYRRNEMARALRTGRANRLGLMLPSGTYLFTNDYFLHLMQGMIDELNHSKMSLALHLTPGDEREPGYLRQVNEIAASGAVDGLLLFSYTAAYRAPRAGDAPVLICGNPAPDPVNHVDCDNLDGAAKATEHLLSLGHRRILHVGFAGSAACRIRAEGFRRALAGHAPPLAADLMVEGDLTREGGRAAVARALDTGMKFTAVFAANDLTALGAIDELARRQLRVPEEVSVIGFDDIVEAERVGLTTIHQPVYEIGRAAVSALLAIIENPAGAPVHRDLPVELIPRRTTARANG